MIRNRFYKGIITNRRVLNNLWNFWYRGEYHIYDPMDDDNKMYEGMGSSNDSDRNKNDSLQVVTNEFIVNTKKNEDYRSNNYSSVNVNGASQSNIENVSNSIGKHLTNNDIPINNVFEVSKVTSRVLSSHHTEIDKLLMNNELLGDTEKTIKNNSSLLDHTSQINRNSNKVHRDNHEIINSKSGFGGVTDIEIGNKGSIYYNKQESHESKVKTINTIDDDIYDNLSDGWDSVYFSDSDDDIAYQRFEKGGLKMIEKSGSRSNLNNSKLFNGGGVNGNNGEKKTHQCKNRNCQEHNSLLSDANDIDMPVVQSIAMDRSI